VEASNRQGVERLGQEPLPGKGKRVRGGEKQSGKRKFRILVSPSSRPTVLNSKLKGPGGRVKTEGSLPDSHGCKRSASELSKEEGARIHKDSKASGYLTEKDGKPKKFDRVGE